MQYLQANTGDISRLSVLSANRLNHSKCSPSTQPQESPSLNSQNNCEQWHEFSSSKHLKINRQIERLSRIQEQTQRRFKTYIDFMLGQVGRNCDHNARLAKEVSHLREEIEETAKDIEVIQKFMRKSSKRQTKVTTIKEGKSESRSGRDLLGSISRSKEMLMRRTQGKLFRSKLSER